jgi:hypothetical protein
LNASDELQRHQSGAGQELQPYGNLHAADDCRDRLRLSYLTSDAANGPMQQVPLTSVGKSLN